MNTATGTAKLATRIGLIREFFGNPKMDDMKSLTDTDKAELGSAIARSNGLSAESVDFALVAY